MYTNVLIFLSIFFKKNVFLEMNCRFGKEEGVGYFKRLILFNNTSQLCGRI